uniref:Uncharacterized protein n=1 Tax=Candidatus Kentrum sp. LPFa TaxID=2126335 RepID=A0A450VVI8_9GAMM|nr:MAG: hypothetical protein BECKLPF1236B_GA0070989_100433 [Candidatus Kentron sp. LPFa]
MHKISPAGRDDIFFIYAMEFLFRLGRVRVLEIFTARPKRFYPKLRSEHPSFPPGSDNECGIELAKNGTGKRYRYRENEDFRIPANSADF